MAFPIGTPRPCKGCGTTIFKSTFCKADCRTSWYARTSRERDAAARRKAGVLTWSERYAGQADGVRSGQCVVCQRQFERRRASKDAGLCCSRECGFELIHQRSVRSRMVKAAKAEFARWARRAAAKPKRPRFNTCRSCGIRIDKGKQRCEPCREKRRLLSRAAAKQTDGYLVMKRAAKARRRAVVRGADAERFDPFEIFDRDGWRCHICGCSTPRRLRGTYEDRAPELDHVIPLAAGGEHSRKNTACSCRKCNIAKADRPLGQLRLIA